MGEINNSTGSCLCNHLTEFSIRKATEAAAVDSNAAATVNFGAVEDYDIMKNPIPVIVCGTIHLLFIILYILSNRLDNRDKKAKIMELNAASATVVPMTIFQRSTSRFRKLNESRNLKDSINHDLTSMPSEN